MKRFDPLLRKEMPDVVLAVGDVNSTIACSLVASKTNYDVGTNGSRTGPNAAKRPLIAHVEAGLRSYNRRMPEEINRVLADHISDLLLCPSEVAVNNLSAEGITKGVHVVGDVMLDVLNWAKQQMNGGQVGVLERLGLRNRGYVVATIHRSENTDELEKLTNILKAFDSLAEPVVFPVHPRTRKVIAGANVKPKSNVCLIEPLGYLDMVELLASARLALTDSGGLQKEAYWLGVPCVTLRDETEWVETVATGWNMLVGADCGKIVHAVHSFVPPTAHPELYGDGSAALRCVELIGAKV
jgi:UDP-N-acetylglucosamine 2-epimerase